jgi:hypothetical protein
MSKSKQKKQQDNNDFWNDCLNEKIIDLKNTKLRNIEINTNNNYSNKIKRNKKMYRNNTKPTIQNSDIIKEALIFEENNKPENNKKIIQSIEHMISLYNRGMASKATQKKIIAQNTEKNLKIEKEACSFKPRQYRNKSLQSKIKKDYGHSTIYERGLKYQQKRMAKIAKLFEENYQKDNEIYPFHPEVTYKNLNHVFYSDNFCKDQADNDSNKIFLFRLMKAREEEEYKKTILENNVKPRLDKNWSFPKKLKRSVSQKDSMIIKRTLHDTLLNLKCLPTNNSKDDDNNNFFGNENNEELYKLNLNK